MYSFGIVPGTVRVLDRASATTTCVWNAATGRYDCTGPAQPGETILIGESPPAPPTRSAAWERPLPQSKTVVPGAAPTLPVWLIGIVGVVGISAIVLAAVLSRR